MCSNHQSKRDNMTKAINSRICILLVVTVVLGGTTDAAFQQAQQQPQQQQSFRNNFYQSHTLNTSGEQQKTARLSKANAPYDHVEGLDIRVLDRFDHRYADGSYEYRFELSDGTARYERGYFLSIDGKKELVVVGYYSYRMPDGQFVTVFYNADRYGYRQNQAITRETYPELPRTIEVPETKEVPSTATLKPAFVTSSTTKRNHL